MERSDNAEEVRRGASSEVQAAQAKGSLREVAREVLAPKFDFPTERWRLKCVKRGLTSSPFLTDGSPPCDQVRLALLSRVPPVREWRDMYESDAS